MVKGKENYIHAKIKEEKLGHGLQLDYEEKHQCICMDKIWIPKLFKSIGRGYWRDEGTQRYFLRRLISLNWQCKISLVNSSTWILLRK